MDIRQIVGTISEMTDRENGGDNALNGFEFQVSSAIYLIFEQYKENQEFALMYEKLEDFIIINNKINLYQSKGVNYNITPAQLSKNRSSTVDNQSIIEKMYDNYVQVKEALEDVDVETNLIICETRTFSKNLWDSSENYTIDIENISFDSFGERCKEAILSRTRYTEYDWDKMKARRLIPKSRHEEVTRMFIEDVITEKKGENKINSKALYGALVYEISRIRKNKSFISNESLDRSLSSFIILESDIQFDSIKYLLESRHQRNLNIVRCFEEFKISSRIACHPVNNDFDLILSIYDSSFADIYAFLDEIKSNILCKNLVNRLDEFEILTLALLVICKEEGLS